MLEPQWLFREIMIDPGILKNKQYLEFYRLLECSSYITGLIFSSYNFQTATLPGRENNQVHG